MTPFFPEELLPGEAPEGWEPDGLDEPLGYLSSSGRRCEKISIGPFERGPVMFVTDSHTKGNFPAGCVAGISNSSNSVEVLNMMFIDDPEVAEFLNRTYQMPVAVADIQASSLPAGSLTLNEWAWTPAQGEPSKVTIHYEGQTLDFDYMDRFFWEYGTGLVMLQFDTVQTRALTGFREATGTFGAPSVFAEFMDGNFAGTAEWYPTATTAGTFTLYRDRLCEDPIPDPDT